MRALIERELRVSARQRWPYAMRMTAALLVALPVLGAMLFDDSTSMGGRETFAVASHVVFVAVSLLTFSLASPSVLDERRKGTLGLLLLTPLHPWELGVGKWVAQFLMGMTLVLAAFPVLCMPYMMGGLMMDQMFAALAAILAQAMICVSVTLAASSLGRNVVIIFMFASIGIFGVEILEVQHAGDLVAWCGISRPVSIFINPMHALTNQFESRPESGEWAWLTLCTGIFVSLLCLPICSWGMTRNFQGTRSRVPWLLFFKGRRKWGNRPMPEQFIYWLEWSRWKPLLSMAIVILSFLGGMAMLYWEDQGWVAFLFNGLCYLYLVGMTLVIVRKIQVQREERSLELLMCAPIRDFDWVQQQIRASRMEWMIPLLCLGFFGSLLMPLATLWIEDSMGFTEILGAMMGVLSLGGILLQWYYLTIASIYYGLSEKTMGQALGKILLYFILLSIICIPWIPFMIASGTLRERLQRELRMILFERQN